MATPPNFADADRVRLGAACARALAGRVDLPGLDRADTRGRADALACQARFALPPAGRGHRPPGLAGSLFDALTQARAQALGAQWLAGVAANLDAPRGPPADQQALWRDAAFEVFRGRAAPFPQPFVDELRALQAGLDRPLRFAEAAAALALRWAGRLRAGAGSAVATLPLDAAEAPVPAGQDADPAEAPEMVDPPMPEPASDPGAPLAPMPAPLAAGYRIFSRRDDRVVTPEQLAPAAELAALRAELDAELAPHRHLVTRLAHRLQRVLLARRREHWDADQDTGQLDPSRLARLVADPSRTQVFRQAREGPFRHAAVTLLLDNSGSMRGRPIRVAALTADILARTLERCAIPVEVLGFTTADGEGGAPRRDWLRAGCPPEPGRLTALRHIVYKPMDMPWRRTRLGWGALLKPDLLQENVDGEALAWASQRLLQRCEARRLLIVVSDGAPRDRSTQDANSAALLEQHLHQVIGWIEGHTDLCLCAVGIGHPVARYYRRAIHLDRAERLGHALCEWLADQLARGPAP